MVPIALEHILKYIYIYVVREGRELKYSSFHSAAKTFTDDENAHEAIFIKMQNDPQSICGTLVPMSKEDKNMVKGVFNYIAATLISAMSSPPPPSFHLFLPGLLHKVTAVYFPKMILHRLQSRSSAFHTRHTPLT